MATAQAFSAQPLRFVKCHTDGNSFVIVESPYPRSITPREGVQLALNICNSNTGIGADGLILVSSTGLSKDEIKVELWNSDGSQAEISGNGTCGVGAYLAYKSQLHERSSFTAHTAAGKREVQLLQQSDKKCRLLVNMGQPVIHDLFVNMIVEHSSDVLEATTLNVGNPQCAIFYEDDLNDSWKEISADIAKQDRFPHGVNVSFSRVINRHTVETFFFERGAGETPSSGTGSIGAAVTAIARGIAQTPVTVRTVNGGHLKVNWDGPGHNVSLEGHSEVVGEGVFFSKQCSLSN